MGLPSSRWKPLLGSISGGWLSKLSKISAMTCKNTQVTFCLDGLLCEIIYFNDIVCMCCSQVWKAAVVSSADGLQHAGHVRPVLYSLNIWCSWAGFRWTNSTLRDDHDVYKHMNRSVRNEFNNPHVDVCVHSHTSLNTLYLHRHIQHTQTTERTYKSVSPPCTFSHKPCSKRTTLLSFKPYKQSLAITFFRLKTQSLMCIRCMCMSYSFYAVERAKGLFFPNVL